MEPLELEEMPVQVEIEEAPDQVSLKITTVFDCCWSDFVHCPLSGDGVLPDPAVGAKTKG